MDDLVAGARRACDQRKLNVPKLCLDQTGLMHGQALQIVD